MQQQVGTFINLQMKILKVHLKMMKVQIKVIKMINNLKTLIILLYLTLKLKTKMNQ